MSPDVAGSAAATAAPPAGQRRGPGLGRRTALVVVGGAVGAAAREGLVLTVPDVGGLPLAIALANILGAFVLGLLVESLTRRRPAPARGLTLRLLLGTGFCGGFTTYSTLATGTALLLSDGAPGTAVGYAVATVLLGAAATVAGIAVAARRSEGASASGAPPRTRPGEDAP